MVASDQMEHQVLVVGAEHVGIRRDHGHARYLVPHPRRVSPDGARARQRLGQRCIPPQLQLHGIASDQLLLETPIHLADVVETTGNAQVLHERFVQPQSFGDAPGTLAHAVEVVAQCHTGTCPGPDFVRSVQCGGINYGLLRPRVPFGENVVGRMRVRVVEPDRNEVEAVFHQPFSCGGATCGSIAGVRRIL